MSQGITLWGASYSNVPSVLLPKTGGGTASFTDVTDTTATASDVASGKYFYAADGTRTQGTSSGGGGAELHVAIAEPVSSSNNTIIFTDMPGEPTSFFLLNSSGISVTSTTTLASLAWDGTEYHGQTVSNTSNAQASAITSGFSHVYTNGTLNIICNNAYIDGDYALVYSYGGGAIDTKQVQVGSGATSITFTGLEDEPAYWSCVFTSNFGTSSGYQRTMWSAYDGDLPFGMCMDSSAKWSDEYWTASYSNGSLTITSQGTNAGGYFHQPGYYRLTYAYDATGNYQSKTVTPSGSTQTVTADSGYDALRKVTVNPIPSSYVQPTTTVGATTYRASTSSQTIQSGTYHSAAATIAAVSATNLEASNIKSGTTISISNGQSNLWSVTGTYSGGGSSWAIDTKTTTSSNRPTSLSFTSMKGEPHAFFLRCTSSMSRSSNSSYYYVADMRYNGTNTTGNCWRMSNGNWTNITSGYSYTYSGTTLTVSSSGSTSTSPGCFYPGNYELVYVY